ncbi:hypothetical protein [Myroides sp. LJL110]
MRFIPFEFSPFCIELSFDSLIAEIKKYVCDSPEQNFKKAYYQDLLNRLEKVPGLLSNSISEQEIRQNYQLVGELFEVLFPFALSQNEIKGVALPLQEVVFNHTDRFKKILDNAKKGHVIKWRNFDQHQYYIICCCIIMNLYFKTKFDLTRPLFVDIPDKQGIMFHYRVLYNADFVKVIPNENAIMLTQADIELLQDNYDNLDLWKKYFPEKSWNLRGFGILSMVDVTTENALTLLKEALLRVEYRRFPIGDLLKQVFSSIFRVANLTVGYTHLEDDYFIHTETLEMMGLNSTLFDQSQNQVVLSPSAIYNLVKKQKLMAISDVKSSLDLEPKNAMLEYFVKKNVKSIILAPVIFNERTVGVVEVVSSVPRTLNSVNAKKLDHVMPIFTETLERTKTTLINNIEAIIQREFTSIHPSVYWRFLQEGYNTYSATVFNREYIINPIVFSNVFPLYGEIDIQGSSEIRNRMIIKDLSLQLQSLLDMLVQGNFAHSNIVIEKYTLKLNSFLKSIKESFYSGMEHHIENYIKEFVHPLVFQDSSLKQSSSLNNYKYFIDHEHQSYYRYRKIYDLQVAKVNKVFSDLLDLRQNVAQQVYPHYYERFKTDGVDHNLYIGESIAESVPFDITYLQYLRLWQLQTLVELMCVHYKNSSKDLITMQVTALIFVYDTALSIQFKMDEKRFDVDGSYNTRFEVIKKRLDKAFIKGTKRRIVAKKKICLVFASQKDLQEYMSYIEFGQSIGFLKMELEEFDVEDLQGVAGLKAIRIGVDLDFDLEKLDYVNLMSNYLKSRYSAF